MVDSQQHSGIKSSVFCKYCGSHLVVKFGKYKGIQRYFCKYCNRKFKSDNNLYHMKARPEFVIDTLSMFFRGFRVRDIRKYLDIKYDYYPTKSVIYSWINKYTGIAGKITGNYRPAVGDQWDIGETEVEFDGEKKGWIIDVKDMRTRFLLYSGISEVRSLDAVKNCIHKSIKLAGKVPQLLLVDQHNKTIDVENKLSLERSLKIINKPLNLDMNYEMMERFVGVLGEKKTVRIFRNIAALESFNRGWTIYYNYFKIHNNLDGKTPAGAAGILYSITGWSDLVRNQGI